MRIDKWLWAVRLFKTRSQATEACRAGQVKWNGDRVKPSLEVRPGQRLRVNKGGLEREIKVLATLEKRVCAQAVEDYLADETPQERIDAYRSRSREELLLRDRGTGRPTKKDRREIERLKNHLPG